MMLEHNADPSKNSHASFQTFCKNKLVDLESIKFFLHHKADPSNILHNNTPFHSLCSNPNFTREMLELMIERGVDILSSEYRCITPFFHYCKHKNLKMDVLKIFLDKKCDINQKLKNNLTPFLLLCKNKSINSEMFNLLMEQKPDVKIVTSEKETVLHYLCKNENVAMEMLSHFKDEISKNLMNEEGKIPLSLYISNENPKLKVVKYLVDQKANLKFEEEKNKTTLLHLSLSNSASVEILEYLLEKKADPHSKDYRGFTPLHFLCKSDHITLEKLELLLKKIDLKMINTKSGGESPFHILCRNSKVNNDLLKVMIEHKANPHLKNKNSSNAAHILCYNRKYDPSTMFFADARLLNEKDTHGSSPLILNLSKESRYDTIKFFLKRKADPNLSLTSQKYNGFHFLFKFKPHKGKEMETLKLFFEYKANPNLANSSKQTPFQKMCSSKYLSLDAVKIFVENKARFSRLVSSPKGESCLHRICSNEKVSLEIIKIFIENKTIIESESKINSPLHSLCQNNTCTPQMIQYLIDKGCKVNQTNSHGLPPLFCMFYLLDRADLNPLILENLFCLVSAGASVNVLPDQREKENVFHFLARHGIGPLSPKYHVFCEIVALLIANKANPLHKNANGKTALQIHQNDDQDFDEKKNPSKISNVLKSVVELFLEKGTVWTLKRHYFYEKEFRTKIFNFFVSLKVLSKKKKFFFFVPKPVLLMIVEFSSSVSLKELEENEKKRDEKKEKKGRKLLIQKEIQLFLISFGGLTFFVGLSMLTYSLLLNSE
eukprot:TRINITY_DN10340_c0_g1_i2.p1 TRINITY_DN10340_c0_g1~~TRINITY_DN10340_c0_g1_i2.p1  ORF type:complete len:775 (+),score=223.05 TRINITY_DN10340_c0_g1_i2:645-2969(+)